MECYTHPGSPAVGVCVICGRCYCTACRFERGGNPFCSERCADARRGTRPYVPDPRISRYGAAGGPPPTVPIENAPYTPPGATRWEESGSSGGLASVLGMGFVFGLIGCGTGYAIFGQVNGHYIRLGELFSQHRGLLDTLVSAVARFDEIRRNILLSGAAGAVLGIIIGAFSRKGRL